MGGKSFLSFTGLQQGITISLMAMKTTTITGKNQKLCRKMRKENVEAI